MTDWTLKLFGEFHLSSHDGNAVTALGRRDRAVLAYLALAPNKRESRERLATLLWSNRGDEQARHSLAQSTAAVRKALGDAEKTLVVSEASSLAIDWTQFDIDVLRFRTLVAEGTREALEQAVAIYQDDLLPGFEVRSEGFDEWITGERERLRQLAIDALIRLAAFYVEDGVWDAAIETANRALVLDNLREDAHRLLMRAYAQSGQRALALQQHKSLCDTLEIELQVTPEAETQALLEEIRAGRLANGAAVTVEPTAPNGVAPVAIDGAPDEPPRRAQSFVYWASGGVFSVLLALVIAVTVVFWRVPELAPAPVGSYIRDVKTTIEPHPLSIAVLPFESHGDPDAVDIAEALSGGITTALSISSEMRVVSRSEVRRFEVGTATSHNIAKQLNVRYLLEGTVNKWGDQIGIELGLIDTRQGQYRIWSESYGRQAGNIIQTQHDVTFDVITQLEIRLTEGEQERITQLSGTQNFEAWLAAARGEKHLRALTPQDNAIARANYQRALDLDPQYAGAMEGLAWTHFVAAHFGWTSSPQDSVMKARQLAERTLELDPERPQAFSLLGSLSLLAGDFTNAVAYGEKGLNLDPNDADVAALLAYTLTYTGEPKRAGSLIERAISLRPVSPQWYGWLRGRAYRLTGRLNEAIDVLRESTQDSPASAIPLVELAVAYSESGRLIQARHTGNEILRLNPRFTIREWLSMSPYKDPAALEKEAAALRSAGLPD